MTDLALFDFPLPDHLIAQRPADKRDGSRLMTLDRQTGLIGHRSFTDLPDLLRPDDLLVVNDTRVIPARLKGHRATGGGVEILLARSLGKGRYEAMIRPMAKLKEGETITLPHGAVRYEGRIDGGLGLVAFGSEEEALAAATIDGDVPLPPYIYRPEGHADEDDRERYQTLFAHEAGSCAAPTAGLHFSEDVLGRLTAKGVETVRVTLHVGPGTFRPVTSETIEEHRMDAENFSIANDAAERINRAKRDGRRIVAVGSTATRALESAVGEDGFVRAGSGETRMYITPGYRFNVIDGLLTNFHLPKSTLIILVAAFAGREKTMNAYIEAVRHNYRFFSYGDAMFIF